MPTLANGTPFPPMTLPLVGSGELAIPGDLAEGFAVVLAYRGAWCPLCNEQLAQYAAHQDELAAAGIKVVALSVEPEADAAALVAKHGIAFSVAHSVDRDTFAAATGAYTADGPSRIEPAAFVLMPGGTVGAAVIASSPVGRLTASEAIRFVNFVRSQRKD